MNKELETLIAQPEYNFLQEDERLGNNIVLLGISGSRAYGTNIDTPEYKSDYDLRGIAVNTKKEILLGKDFEQFTDSTTDTCIYSFNKFIRLVTNCNPNTIELLGLRNEDYAYMNTIGKELIDNRSIFLSKLAINTFCGYANAQLRRIENFMAQEKYPQYKKEMHTFNSVKNTLSSTLSNYAPIKCANKENIIESMSLTKNASNNINLLNKNFANIFKNIDSENEMKLYIDKSKREGMDVEIFGDFNLSHFPLRDFFDMFQDMSNVIRQFEKLGKRNTKKDDIHLNKHAMHLVRLYYTAFDILENKTIITYRDKEHDLLMDIRNGKFMNDEGLFIPEFFELVNELEKRLQYDTKNTDLPDVPDFEKIDDFRASINEKIVKGKIEKIIDKTDIIR